MLTDIRPIVEKLIQRLVLAGLPLVAACDGGGRLLDGAGGTTGTGGTGSEMSGSGGSGGGGSTGTGSVTGSGGATGTGGAGIGVACQPFSATCGGTAPTCGSPIDGGLIPVMPIPLVSTTVDFTPDDPRWVDLYRACLAGGDFCGPDCLAFCRAVVSPIGPMYYPVHRCEVTCGTPAQLTYAQPAGVCGRRPSADGSGRCAGDGETALGRYLAGAAALEAASVPAFGRLARDLAAHAAPDPLVRAARAAMGEEARHWRRTRDVARRRGGLPARPPIAPASFATLEEVALDNVVEGCVRETFGALIAAHQAAAAQDTEVRDLMAGITDDELGHAALSWQIDAWATPRLGPGFAERRRTTARAAVHELLLAFSAPVDGELRAAAGLPGPDEARALMAAAWAGVWQPAFGAPAAG